jgi:hypothetical protein
VQRTSAKPHDYINQMIKELSGEHIELWFIGRMVEFIKIDNFGNSIKTFRSISELVEEIE